MYDPFSSKRLVYRVTGEWALATDWKLISSNGISLTQYSTKSGKNFYEGGVFPSVQAIARLKANSFVLPLKCAKCGEQTEDYRFLSPRCTLRHTFPMSVLSKQRLPPYCTIHSGRDYPGAEIVCHYRNTYFLAMTCYSQSDVFAVEFVKLLSCGDIVPPFIAFSGAIPYFGWGQGVQEGWWHGTWAPFWRGLSHADRVAYGKRWQLTGEWHDYLFDPNQFDQEWGSNEADRQVDVMASEKDGDSN